jgi:hypothetical protein
METNAFGDVYQILVKQQQPGAERHKSMSQQIGGGQ